MIRKMENFTRVDIRFQMENYEDIGIQIVSTNEKGERLVATGFKFEVREDGKEYGATALLATPTHVEQVKGSESAAQKMMDKLLELGVKPTMLAPRDEIIKSLEYHLEDMRKLVFGPGSSFSNENMKIDPDKV